MRVFSMRGDETPGEDAVVPADVIASSTVKTDLGRLYNKTGASPKRPPRPCREPASYRQESATRHFDQTNRFP